MTMNTHPQAGATPACAARYPFDLDGAPVVCTLPSGHDGAHEAPITTPGWEGSAYVWDATPTPAWERIAEYADGSGPYYIDVDMAQGLIRTGYGPQGGDSVVQHITRTPEHDGVTEVTVQTERFSLADGPQGEELVLIDGRAYAVGSIL